MHPMKTRGFTNFNIFFFFSLRHGLKLGFMSAFVKASAYALQQQPVVNAVIDGQEMVYRDFVDISVAVATPKVSFGAGFLFSYYLRSVSKRSLCFFGNKKQFIEG